LNNKTVGNFTFAYINGPNGMYVWAIVFGPKENKEIICIFDFPPTKKVVDIMLEALHFEYDHGNVDMKDFAKAWW